MVARYVVAHRADPNNVGDIASNPLQYFLNETEYQVIDVSEIGRSSYNDQLPLIVGGGGLIGNDSIGDDYLRELLESSDRLQLEEMYARSWNLANEKNKSIYDRFTAKYQELISGCLNDIPRITAPRFVWGAGFNSSPEIDSLNKIRWPKALSAYRLVGVRDFGENSRYPFVPCASCMHPALSKKYSIKNDIIFFEHKKQLIKATDFGSDSIPRFINSGSNIEQTIELLGSANTILTNSYHGAYWGILLKKRVIIMGAWSSKFHFMKHKVPIVNKKDDWKLYLEHNQLYDTALDECVSITEDWWRQIRQCL